MKICSCTPVSYLFSFIAEALNHKWNDFTSAMALFNRIGRKYPMHIDFFFQRNLPGEPLAWIDNTRPRDLWVKVLGFVLVIDRRKRLPPEPIMLGGVSYPPHPKTRGKLAE